MALFAALVLLLWLVDAEGPVLVDVLRGVFSPERSASLFDLADVADDDVGVRCGPARKGR